MSDMDKEQTNNNEIKAEVMDFPLKNMFCPICHKPASSHYQPFCSKHCADVDLNRWLTGVYCVPVQDNTQTEDNNPQNEE